MNTSTASPLLCFASIVSLTATISCASRQPSQPSPRSPDREKLHTELARFGPHGGDKFRCGRQVKDFNKYLPSGWQGKWETDRKGHLLWKMVSGGGRVAAIVKVGPTGTPATLVAVVSVEKALQHRPNATCGLSVSPQGGLINTWTTQNGTKNVVCPDSSVWSLKWLDGTKSKEVCSAFSAAECSIHVKTPCQKTNDGIEDASDRLSELCRQTPACRKSGACSLDENVYLNEEVVCTQIKPPQSILTGCNPVGHWVASAKWGKGNCKRKGVTKELDFFLVKSNDEFSPRVLKGAPPRLSKITSSNGRCVLLVEESVNLCASCNTVELANYKYTIEERDGKIRGHLKYNETDGSDDGIMCSQDAMMLGKKKSIKKGSLQLKTKAVKRHFKYLRDNCNYKISGHVKVRLLLKPEGGLEKLWLNGVEKLEECGAPRLEIWIDQASFPNPTGKQQSVSFSMRFPRPNCKVECSNSGACLWKNGACRVRSARDCRASYACKQRGKCSYVGGSCELTSNSDCRRTTACQRLKKCFFLDGECVVKEDLQEIESEADRKDRHPCADSKESGVACKLRLCAKIAAKVRKMEPYYRCCMEKSCRELQENWNEAMHAIDKYVGFIIQDKKFRELRRIRARIQRCKTPAWFRTCSNWPGPL